MPISPEDKRLLVKLGLGVAAIGTAGVVIHHVITAPVRAQKEIIKKLIDEKFKLLREFLEEGNGALTPEQQRIIDDLDERIGEETSRLAEMGLGITKAVEWVAAAIVAVAAAYVIGKGLGYLTARAKQVKTHDGACALMWNAVNISFAEEGMVPLAIASQTSLEMWASTTLYPAMSTEIAALTAQLPTLTGFSLMWAQYMILALQIEMTMTIPAFIMAAWALIPLIYPKGYRSFTLYSIYGKPLT